jgi:proteasome accessory factor B
MGMGMGMPLVERLVNLTIALLETRRPMTFEELRRRTGYYPQPDHATARRMFERDKETLRSLGVPIETRHDTGMEDPGYLIDRRTYELRGVDLDADEVAALALAVDMVGASEGALPLAKVAAHAPDPSPLDRPPTRVGLALTTVDPLAAAVVERRVVRFQYRTADGRVGTRSVEPYGIVQRRRAWYLVGLDRDRGEPRGFRTDRMLDHPEVLDPAGAFERPPGVDLAEVISGPDVPPVSVTLEVAPAGRWMVETRGGMDLGPTDDGNRRMRVDGLDPVRDRAWLLGISPESVVHDPPEIRRSLEHALEAVLAVHGATDVEVHP